MWDITSNVALVTGGAQGIGFGIARELARAGTSVVIADRDLPRAKSAADELIRSGHQALALALEVTSDESIANCVQAALAHFVHIDILVNNAGIHCEKIGQVSTVEHFAQCFDVNLFGVWRVSQALIPHFKKRGSGKIINIASINGRKPWVDTPAYSASKAAVLNLTQSLAAQLGAHNINVNAVCPGGVMTAMADSFKPDRPAMLEGIIGSRVLKRELVPEDIGHAVVFFASPQARNITGQSLNVDGGTIMS
jgi:NAD(P)-dependent dehydrogenase (short-subunit alcohol dehydrogenase family)